MTTRRRPLAAWSLALTIGLTACTASPATNDSAEASDLTARITAFLDLKDEYDKVRAVLVYEADRSVLEMYRGEDAKGFVNARSVTKSVMGTLIGIAIDDGLIGGVDATLGELLPAYEAAMTDEVAAIPLRSILTHTANFADETELDIVEAPDTVGAILADRAERGAGDGSFQYSSAGSHLLAAVLDQVTGVSILDFARARLLDPLGIDTDPAWTELDGTTPKERIAAGVEYDAADFAWPVDAQGIATGWSLMKLRPDDLAKLGRLYLQNGEWEGEQLVSADWVRTATTEHVRTFTTPNGYGYQWWTQTTEDVSMSLALGYAGNVVAVVPDRDMVVVVASEYLLTDDLADAQKFDVTEAVTLVQDVIVGS